MKRLLLLFVLVLATTAVPATAGAASTVLCRNTIYNDWYHDGKIASTYPISCYRDAIKHAPRDAAIYSSLQDDIRSAMQAAIRRQNGATNVPLQVGKGLPVSLRGGSKGGPKGGPGTKTTTGPSVIVAPPVSDTSSGSGIPVPLLVLGGIAILLIAAGAVGMVARRRRGNDPAV